MEIAILSNEVLFDPLGRGYAAMSDKQVADSLNTANRAGIEQYINKQEVWDAILLSEFNALSTAGKSDLWNWLQMLPETRISTSGNNVILLVSLFGGGSTTVNNLSALRNILISRATELGLSVIREGWIKEIRS